MLNNEQRAHDIAMAVFSTVLNDQSSKPFFMKLDDRNEKFNYSEIADLYTKLYFGILDALEDARDF